MTLPVNKIICGDAKTELAKLPEGSINCCISSPPYWALRDYGVDGQLGLEKTFEQYIDDLCSIYDEVKRVLRPDGTCFVNLGDTYNCLNWANRERKHDLKVYSLSKTHCQRSGDWSLPNKCLCLIPQRFAIEMVNRGWILRNVVIWHKPNPMPSSAKDRFTVDFEYVYFFVKNKRYWFEPQYEALQDPERNKRRMFDPDNTERKQQYDGKSLRGQGVNPNTIAASQQRIAALGRNKRTVWTIPTQAFSEAHFATFPEKLVEPMILSGCPEFVCKKCGKGRRKVYDVTGGTIGKSWHEHKNDNTVGMSQDHCFGLGEKLSPTGEAYNRTIKGYTDCGCGAGWRPGVTLDMFAGAMTTALVAYKNRRDYVMIELKKSYCEMGQKRLDSEKEKYGLFEKTLDKRGR